MPYEAGQFFELESNSGNIEHYILVYTGEGYYLIECRSGNRWCEPYQVQTHFGGCLTDEEWGRVLANNLNDSNQ